jgi:GcrA cell cycle regulator
MSWTDERVELLRKLWSDGLSASQVAAELGPGITRNAVIGKIHRLGLAERAKTTSALRPRAAKSSRPAAPAPRGGGHVGHGHVGHGGVVHGGTVHGGGVIHGNVALAFAPQTVAVARTAPEDEVVIPLSERVTLMDLRESMCRWPMGDPTTPEFRFCGGRSPVGGGPYCAHHARVAYQPAQDRRRSREQLKAPRYA